jgi:ABC-2 type transport system permease protein
MALPVETSPNQSVIHDIGYQRYTGARLGRWHGMESLYVHSLRTVFGLGRGAKAKVFPWLIVGIVVLWAVIIIAVRSLAGADAPPFVTYRGFVTGMAYPVMMFLAISAPELVSRDLRDRVLPLYFSRPLSRVDYALTKLAALMSAIMLLLGTPQLLIFLGAVFSQKGGFSGAMTELGNMGKGLTAALVYAFVLAGLSLLIASLSGRRAFGAAGIVAVFLITTPIVGILLVLGRDNQLSNLAALANPMTATNGVIEWLYGTDTRGGSLIGNYGPVYGGAVLLLVVVSVGLLLQRYRKVPS